MIRALLYTITNTSEALYVFGALLLITLQTLYRSYLQGNLLDISSVKKLSLYVE